MYWCTRRRYRSHMIVLTYFLLMLVSEIIPCYAETEIEFVTEMTPEKFEQFRSENINGIISFYQSWCGHSIRLSPDWDRLGQEFSSNNLVIGKFNCGGDHDSFCKEKDIHQWPTLLYYINGKEYIYSGSLSFDNLSLFVLENISPRCEFNDISNCSEKAAFFLQKWKQKSNKEILNELSRLELLFSESDDLKLELKRWIRERILILTSYKNIIQANSRDEI